MSGALPSWLDDDFQRLCVALEAGRLGHALLLHGPAGWGQELLANAIALAVIGRAPNAGQSLEGATVAHPDLRWLAPATGKQIRIDEVRALGEFIVQTPQRSARKAAVITPADAINLHAANALLKMLEEPPPGSHLILVTSALAELLPTLRSRCQLVAVRPASAETALDWVRRQREGIDAAQLAALAFEHGHAPLALLDAVDAGDRPIADALGDALTGARPDRKLIDRWYRSGNVDALLMRWMRYLADAVCAGPVGRPARLQVLDRVPPAALHQFWRELSWARRLVRGTSNPNVTLLLESLFLDWRDLGAAKE